MDIKQYTPEQPMSQRKKLKAKPKNILNKNRNRKYPNLWDAAKAILRGTFIAVSTYIKKIENLK